MKLKSTNLSSHFLLLFSYFLLLTFHSFAQTIPVHDHVVICIMENHGYPQIIGATDAPYITSLSNDPKGASFIQSYALTHPSQPNYLMFFSGSSQNVILDFTSLFVPFTTPNLGASLLAASRTFVGYSDGLPSIGFTGDTHNAYARKHSPWINWQGGTTNGIPASLNVPFTDFPTDFNLLPTLSFVIPDLNHDMHDGTIAQGDTWVQTNLDAYVQWAKTHNSLFILTFDENESTITNTPIPTVFVGQNVLPGQYSEHIDHYKVLRTLEDMYSLPYAGSSSSSTPITDCWASTTTSVSAGLSGSDEQVKVFPNPFKETATVKINSELLKDNKEMSFSLFDVAGRKLMEKVIDNKNDNEISISRNNLNNGLYFYRLNKGAETIANGKVVIE